MYTSLRFPESTKPQGACIAVPTESPSGQTHHVLYVCMRRAHTHAMKKLMDSMFTAASELDELQGPCWPMHQGPSVKKRSESDQR